MWHLYNDVAFMQWGAICEVKWHKWCGNFYRNGENHCYCWLLYWCWKLSVGHDYDNDNANDNDNDNDNDMIIWQKYTIQHNYYNEIR